MTKDPTPEERERTVKLAKQIFSNYIRQIFSPDELRELSRHIAALKQPPAPPPQREREPEHLAETIAATRSPQEQAELEKVLEEVRRYRGTGRRG